MLASKTMSMQKVSSAKVQQRWAPLKAPVRGASLIVRAVVEKEKVLDEVRSIIAQQLGTEVDKVAAGAKFVDLGADSLDTVEIMMALEEKFEITLDQEGAEKISTVEEAANMIAAEVAKK